MFVCFLRICVHTVCGMEGCAFIQGCPDHLKHLQLFQLLSIFIKSYINKIKTRAGAGSYTGINLSIHSVGFKGAIYSLYLVSPRAAAATATHDHLISPDICATPSMPCPSCHLRSMYSYIYVCVCVLRVNLGPRRGEVRRQWPRK